MAGVRTGAAAAFAAAVLFSGPAGAFSESDVRKLLETQNCVGCDLSGADLFGADLSRAILSDADLRGADLTGAIFYFAIVQGADLTGANLTRADLYGADLFRSKLDGATTAEARICHTVMPDGQRSYNQCGDDTSGF